jgi:hypothetical protein
MVIDAMDMFHAEDFDAFTSVSSDSDFTGLASRLRDVAALVRRHFEGIVAWAQTRQTNRLKSAEYAPPRRACAG